MAKACSADLRERALQACERGRLSRAKIAAVFQVSESTVYRWLQAWQQEGRRAAKPHAGGAVPRLDEAALKELATLVAEANDLTLAEYAERLAARAEVVASRPTLCRALQKLGLRRKKEPAGAGARAARHRRGARQVAGRSRWARPRATDLPR